MKLHQPLKNTKSNSRPNNGILLVSFCYWSTCIVFQCTLLGVITSVLFFCNIAWWGHFALYTSRCVCALRFFHHLKCSYFQSLFSAFGEVLNSNPTDSTLIFQPQEIHLFCQVQTAIYDISVITFIYGPDPIHGEMCSVMCCGAHLCTCFGASSVVLQRSAHETWCL